jgi:mannose/fructose/N-acetylgalactosamine-specific phosphotransferase system component IIC
MGNELTFAESIDLISKEICIALSASGDAKKIDWTNVKKLLAQLLDKFGPAIIALLLAKLDPDLLSE